MIADRRYLKFLLAGGIVFLIFGIVWQISNVACAIFVLDMGNLLAIFLTGVAIGYVPVKVLGVGLSKGQRIITEIAVGVGVLSLLVLLGGLGGLIRFHWLWRWGVWIGGVIGGILVYVRCNDNAWGDSSWNDSKGKFEGVDEKGGRLVFEKGKGWLVLLLLAVPFLVLAILCVTIPPGVLWSAEGYGYDVLEYHLEVPKEWFVSGRIYHLDNNVYANFPFNAEMLYLLAMILKGSVYDAVYLAQMIHFAFGILFVVAVWVFTRDLGFRSAVASTVSCAICGWVMYLSPLAYNELGMIFSGSVALGLIFVCWRNSEIDVVRMGLLVGLLLGISSGFKYTSVAMIFLPLFVFFCVISIFRSSFLRAAAGSGLLVAGWFVSFCPYLLRNYVWTGNPVFPLCYKYFGGSDFDEWLAERWERGHGAKLGGKEERSFRDKIGNLKLRFYRLYWAGFRNEIVDNFIAESYRSKGEFSKAEEILHPPAILDLPKFGLSILLLPWVIFFTRRQRIVDWMMMFVFLVQTFIWMMFTHLQGRFLIVWLVVLPFLIGRSWMDMSGKGWCSKGNVFLLAVLLISAGFDFKDCMGRYVRHCYTRDGQSIDWFGQHRAFLAGKVPGYEQLGIINKDASAKTMLIAEARPFYYRGRVIYWTVFNRNEFAKFAQGPLYKLKDYIFSVHPDFIFVNWMEAKRLSQTYGFSKSIRPSLFYYLSSPGRFKLKRLGRWGGIIRYDGRIVPARVLYGLDYKKDVSERHEKRVGMRNVRRRRR